MAYTLINLRAFCGTSNLQPVKRLSYVPGIIRGHGPPDVARPTQVPEVVQRMSDMSSPCGTRCEVGAEEVAFALEPAT
jgi:hypothetical protein